MKFLGLLLTIPLLSGICLGQAAQPTIPEEKPKPGQVIERIVCGANPGQTYALYLPSNYSRNRSWPVVFAFDPGARGKVPVELMKNAAEHYGYIVLGSNNSRNGPWKPEADAADAMLRDAQERFSVDLKRIYFAGFSGGARVASQLAQNCKCSAGVLLSGAGFSTNSSPQRDATFPVFSAVGTLDFNYREVIPLQDKLEQAGFPHWLRVFDGVHEWAPAALMDEAFAWFRIQAMRENGEGRDEKFVSSELNRATAAAERYSTGGDSLSAWRQYKQITETYAGLAEVTELRTKADELAHAKAVQDALKHERSDFAEQERLSGQILGALQSKEVSETPRSYEQSSALQDVRDLRQRSESEKKPERAVVLKRALAGIFVGAMESGSSALDEKDFQLATRFFSAAAEARPEAEWPLRQLAVAQALGRDRKAAIETLKKAKTKTRDPAEFSTWVQNEPAFSDLRARREVP